MPRVQTNLEISAGQFYICVPPEASARYVEEEKKILEYCNLPCAPRRNIKPLYYIFFSFIAFRARGISRKIKDKVPLKGTLGVRFKENKLRTEFSFSCLLMEMTRAKIQKRKEKKRREGNVRAEAS